MHRCTYEDMWTRNTQPLSHIQLHDFYPSCPSRLQRFGVDFDALKKLCMGCPDEMWQLMCKCCQVSRQKYICSAYTVVNEGFLYMSDLENIV